MPVPRRLWFLSLLFSSACRAGDSPAVVATPALVRRGLELAAEYGCARCHAGAPAEASAAPRLDAVGARLRPAHLGRVLADAGKRMPDCLVGERDDALEPLVHFLVSLGGPLAVDEREIDAGTIERGRQLYHGVGCVACHPPFEPAASLARPLWEYPDSFEPRTGDLPSASDPLFLGDLPARTGRAALAHYLLDPLAVHPAGRMPALALEPHEAADIAAYLFYEGASARGAALATGTGLVLEYFEASFDQALPVFDALAPVRRTVARSFFEGIERREEDFGFRFRGLIEVHEAGLYTFATTSDDGSLLRIDGRLVVDNRGEHAMQRAAGEVVLAAGKHGFELDYFEHWGGNGLEVTWSGPGFAERALGFESLSHHLVTLPPVEEQAFVLEPGLVERGRELYAELGCAACHPLEAARPPPAAADFADLDGGRGCLAAESGRRRGDAPRFPFAPGEREALAALLEARELPPPPGAAERLEAELVRLGCIACHERGEHRGPSDERRPYFQVEGGLDLGDEGRLPPQLDRAGAKLKRAWMHAVLAEGGRARPYMKTRMPQFGAAQVEPIASLLAEVDAPLRDEREPAFSLEDVEAGKRLVGTKGLGCIQCHELAGHPSLGIPAVDLARVHERIHPGWFRELLMDPVAIQMNTRMPAFWTEAGSPVQDLFEGDPARQVDAIWTYLSLGSSMPLPEGLLPLEGEYEVEVRDRPVCVGVFMKGVSPRTVAVGYPERLHVAFDVQNSRLALAWRGRFFNARGTWHARAGALEEPAGEDVLAFPPGPVLAILERPDDPWPSESLAGAGFQVLGRTTDAARRPVFRYRFGDVFVSEGIVPQLRAGGTVLLRTLNLEFASPNPAWLDLRAAVGREIISDSDGSLLVRGEREVRLRVAPEGARLGSHVEGPDGQRELRIRVNHIGKPIRLELEYSW